MSSIYKSFKEIVANPYMAFFCRIVLGAIFIHAGANKIIDPEGFARSIVNYRILPLESINVLATILPWLEVVGGVFLLLGLFTAGSALIIAFLVAIFFVALSSALIRGIDISCGCFSSDSNNRINILYLFRDLVLFCFALVVLFNSRRILCLDNKLKFGKSSNRAS